jgi:uncharacterized protein YoaH (UPF0181 family)
MTNNKQQTAVDSIIEFCQKQMDNDSSIHKGVYLSIIKFCKEQITEESEIHWKTTLLMMTNNKQQTAVDKAKELIDKMTKPYALIAVDEIYKLNLKTGAYLDSDSDKINYYSYWEEVKNEIENYDKQ